jgi:hypothetical protein
MADNRPNREKLWHPIWVDAHGIQAGAFGRQAVWPTMACLLGVANLQGRPEHTWKRGAHCVSRNAIRPVSFADTRKSSTLSTWPQSWYSQLKSAEPFVTLNPLSWEKTFLDDSAKTQRRHRLQSQCLAHSRIASGVAISAYATPFGRSLGNGLPPSGCSACHKRFFWSVGCERASRDSLSTRIGNAETLRKRKGLIVPEE